jgi:hypothetical protein
LNLQEKRERSQKLLPDLKSTALKAITGAFTGILACISPTLINVTSRELGSAAYNNTAMAINTTMNSTTHNVTQGIGEGKQLNITFNTSRAAMVIIGVTAGTIALALGGAIYDYWWRPPIFRLEADEDYTTQINLLSAYCVERVMERYGTDWDAARSTILAAKVSDVILYDSIGYQKYLHNAVRRKSHPITFSEIGAAYGKLPTMLLKDYSPLVSLLFDETSNKGTW